MDATKLRKKESVPNGKTQTPLLPGEARRPGGGIIVPADDRVPVDFQIPDTKALANLSTSEQLSVSRAYGWYPSKREYQADVQQYVANYSTIPPGARAAEVERLTNPMASKRAALGLARRAQRNYQQQAAVGGDPETQLIWIAEDDEASCAGCLARYSGSNGPSEGTIAEHQDAGMPGTYECGENCRCDLMPIDRKPTGNWMITGAAAFDMLGTII